MLPRPNLEALGVRYRRTPLLSIGRSVYCDTRLIIQKLESHFPDLPKLGASTPDQLILQDLLDSWIVDGGIFARCGQCLPSGLVSDPNFVKDREAYSGRSFTPEYQNAMRPEGLSHLRMGFDFLENVLLADGREWALKTETPSLGDISVIFPFMWILNVPGAIPDTLMSAKTHPRVVAYIDRFRNALKTASSRSGSKPTQLRGAEAVAHITAADFPDAEDSLIFDDGDPLAQVVKSGQTVASWPVDTGFTHHDVGKLVKLDKREVVLEVEGVNGRPPVRVHHPRWNYRVQPVEEGPKL